MSKKANKKKIAALWSLLTFLLGIASETVGVICRGFLMGIGFWWAFLQMLSK